MKEQNHPNVIKIRNAHVHNLKHIDVDIPLNKIVGIAGCPVPESHPCTGSAVCGRFTEISGCVIDLYQKKNDTGTESTGG